MIIILSLKQRKNMTVLILQKGKITSITIEMLLFRFSNNLTICKCICRSHGKSAYWVYLQKALRKKSVHLFIAWSERIMIRYYLVNNDTFMLAFKIISLVYWMSFLSYHILLNCRNVFIEILFSFLSDKAVKTVIQTILLSFETTIPLNLSTRNL